MEIIKPVEVKKKINQQSNSNPSIEITAFEKVTAPVIFESSQNDLKQRSKSQTNHQHIKQTNSRDQKASDSVKPNNYKKSLTHQLPSVVNMTAGLSALDDFDQPNLSTSKAKIITRSPPAQNVSPSATPHMKQKQRIVVPHEKLLRVMGRGNCNIKVIQEVTDAVLELEDKKIPPNQDRSFLISGETVDITRYAFELLQALINDSEVDLLNLLPSNKQILNEIGNVRSKPTLTLSNSLELTASSKWNIETWTSKSTNKQVLT